VTHSTDQAAPARQTVSISTSEVHRPRNVLIVGGGSAGWITAALLRRTAPPDVTITLVESSDIPTVGVGEAALPGMRKVLRYIGVDEAEFFAECDAAFKLGIRFSGWNPDRDFWHPFGATAGPRVLINDWLRGAAAGSGRHIDEELDQGTWQIAATGLAPQSDRCQPYEGDLRVYAYHLDAGLLAELLKKHAIAAGVRHVVDTVTTTTVRPDGWISHVETAAHGELHADLFFDCTGFRGELINQVLGEPFESFGKHLWCDRAVAINAPRTPAERGDLVTYTKSTTGSAGWIWEIPLFSRYGNGYVYSSAYLSPEAAEAELRAYLGVADDIPARHLRMRVGKTSRVWVGNCIAVGLAGGFIEPLESTGLGLIESVGEFFIHHSPDMTWDDALASRMNTFFSAGYDFIRDFVSAHYVTATRDDTPFWQQLHRDPEVRTVGVNEVLDQWHRGDLEGLLLSDGSQAPFSPFSWAYIIGGNGLVPERAAAHVDPDELAAAKAELAASTAAVSRLAGVLPDNRQRVRALRQAWERGERPPAAPDLQVYNTQPAVGYLTNPIQDLRRAAADQA
jgi:tryptophan halogenase